MNENLEKAAQLGQGIWIDSISRDDLVEGGALHAMIEDGVVGVTSNPSIFQKALSESELYDEQLEEASRETDDPKELFWKLAYEAFEEIFSGEDWTFLESKGANKQRPLWASTSTKNPDYKDTIYVDNLIGPDTVNTMPGSTLEATMDHAEIRPTLKEGIEDAKRLPRILAEAGVDYKGVTQTLEKDGVAKFMDSFDELLDEIRQKGRKLVKQ
ncbi:MAG TPA: transaldolase family protein [Rubrobacter sp.]|nr:transaldolase family protein [Rubrobacter sp.]